MTLGWMLVALSALTWRVEEAQPMPDATTCRRWQAELTTEQFGHDTAYLCVPASMWRNP